MTGRVIETSKRIGPRVPFGQTGPDAPALETIEEFNTQGRDADDGLFHESTLEVDTSVYQERLKGDEQSWPALARSLPPRDDGEILTSANRSSGRPAAVNPPNLSGYPSQTPSPNPYQDLPPAQPQHSSVVENIESVAAAQAWPHVALGRGSQHPHDGLTLGVKAVLFVAIASLAVGATIGSVVTLTLLDRSPPTTRRTLAPVLQPDRGDKTKARGTGHNSNDNAAKSGRPTPVAIPGSGPIDGLSPQPSNASLDQGLPNEIVLPITFPKLSADPAEVNRERIKQIADLMLQDRTMMVDIVGYTSPDETGKIVDGLAARRARIAAGLLGGFGPSRSRFRAKSGGISQDLPRKVVLQVRIE